MAVVEIDCARCGKKQPTIFKKDFRKGKGEVLQKCDSCGCTNHVLDGLRVTWIDYEAFLQRRQAFFEKNGFYPCGA